MISEIKILHGLKLLMELIVKKKIYGLFLQKYNNDTIKELLGEEYQSKTDEKIKKYFRIQGSRIMHLYFINNYINVLN